MRFKDVRDELAGAPVFSIALINTPTISETPRLYQSHWLGSRCRRLLATAGNRTRHARAGPLAGARYPSEQDGETKKGPATKNYFEYVCRKDILYLVC